LWVGTGDSSEARLLLLAKRYRQFMDGNQILTDLLEKSKFKSKAQAVASLTFFTHPDTIRPLDNKNIFKIVRSASKRGQITNEHMYDDNHSVQDIFLWANKLTKKKFKDVQFNHIYSDPNSISKYTCLSNIILTPAFIAKLTDTDEKIKDLLKYRVFKIYGYNPDKITFVKPDNYDDLNWLEFLPRQENVQQLFETKLVKCKSNRAIISTRHFGWVFNDFHPILVP
jgi:hypothetical protein